MAREIKVVPNKTYATRDNAIKAVEKRYPWDEKNPDQLRYLILTTEDGRYYPVFVGDAAVQAGTHFHFCTVN